MPANLNDVDRRVLRALEAEGADLTEPRHALFFLYLPDEAGAEAAADEARRQGFRTTVTPPAPRCPQWGLVCERDDLVTSPSTMPSLDSLFWRLATDHDGRYDGWEASV